MKSSVFATIVVGMLLVVSTAANAQTSPVFLDGPCDGGPPQANQHVIAEDGSCQNFNVGPGPCPVNSRTNSQSDIASHTFNVDTGECLGELAAAVRQSTPKAVQARPKLARTGRYVGPTLAAGLSLVVIGWCLHTAGKRRGVKFS